MPSNNMDSFKNSVLEYRLSLERNLASTLNWYIRISQLFGAVPVNLPIRQGIKDGSIASTHINRLTRWAHYIWSIFMILLMCTSMYSRYRQENDKISIENLLDLSEYVFNTGNVLIIMIGCNYQKRWYSQYFNDIIEIDIKLKRCGATWNSGTLRRFLCVSAIVVSIFFLIAVINDCLFRQFVFYNIVRSLAVYILPNIISTLCILQYFCLLFVLRERFSQIVAILQGLLSEYRSMLAMEYRLKGKILPVKSLGSKTKSTNVENKKFHNILSIAEIL